MTNQNKHIHRYHRHMSVSYAVSLRQRLYSFVLVPILSFILVFVVLSKFGGQGFALRESITWGYVFSALIVTFARLLLAYVLALLIAIPLALLINYSPKIERILFPLFDVIQSVPVLAFFPVVILFFVHYNFYNGAAIFVLLVTMAWSIVFSMVGGLQVIPSDIKSAAKVFGLTGINYIDKILLPAVVPYLVTGSLLAWAGGWNIIIVAEVLHTYIPGGSGAMDLFGIGSVLVATSASNNQRDFLMALTGLVVFVALMNFFVWQKLLKYSEKFKFE
ncbi:MAG: ABC transporter permease subunit [Candidatus Doudnabacteria bacterium]|nr:ABC transporter permease subunit [Candidatus Doudnabacteria bacterium]